MSDPILVGCVRGHVYDLLDIQPGDVAIEDLAHNAAQINRYCGAVSYPFSVASHSVLVARLCPELHMLGGLTHDLTEAAGLNDLISPVKRLLPEYTAIEERVRSALARIVFMPATESAEVKAADMLARKFETHYLRGAQHPADVAETACDVAAELLLQEIPWRRSRDLFLDWYYHLIEEMKEVNRHTAIQ